MARITRAEYAALYGPTTGDGIRLGDTALVAVVEHDHAVYGDECLHGGGKTLRDGIGLASGVTAAAGALDMLLCNVVLIDPVLGIVKGDLGLRGGRVARVGQAGNPAGVGGGAARVGAVPAGGRREPRLRDADVHFEVVGSSARYWSPTSHLAVLQVLRQLRATVVHTHHLPALLNAGPAAKALRASRVVHTEHACLYLDELPHARRLLRMGAHLSDALVLVGDALRPYYLRTVGIAPERLHVVPNGIDTDRFRPIALAEIQARRAAAGLPVDRLLIGAVGRLAAVKNFGLLLRAAARARAAGLSVTVAFVGDGEEREALEQLSQELGLKSDVVFLGWRSDVADLVSTFDALAVTSTSEALPLVVLEAMSAAVPVVSTAVGEIPLVLGEGMAGILVPSDDDEAFASALLRLGADERLRRALGERGRERVHHAYSHSAMVERYLALYGLGTTLAA